MADNSESGKKATRVDLRAVDNRATIIAEEVMKMNLKAVPTAPPTPGIQQTSATDTQSAKSKRT